MAHNIHNILTNFILDKELKRCASLYVNGRLIDIGCGTKPYKDIFASYVNEHIGVDYPQTSHGKSNIDIFCSAYKIPVTEGTFDSAICTSVLEHLEEPEIALRECYRVLKPTGIALYAVPFIWHLHEEPRDYYRFSKYGLQYLFEKVGFELVELKALCGFWATFGQLLVYNLYRFNCRPFRWLRIVDIIGLLIQGVALGLDRLDKTEQWTSLYIVVARKP